MARIHVNGIDIAYDTYGQSSNPPLFAAHGLYGSRIIFRSLGKAIQDKFYVVAYDVRGHGESEKPPEYTLADHGHDLLALIEAFGCEKASAMGYSMGSYIVLQAAVLNPERIDRLVPIVTKGHGKTSSVLRYLASKGVDPSKLDYNQMLVEVQGALWCPDTPQTLRDQVFAAEAEVPKLTPQETAAVDKSLLNFDLRPDLHKITAPTLIISAKYDGLNPPDAGQEVADLIPHSAFEVFDKSGHMLIYEETERLARRICEFLTGEFKAIE
ncbi:MAG: alpha/beta hydrolase [Synergistaceae bacterium]|jgi:pimeloyl-ACP methyl ester carboxylesterase|nr:alpha/beta hydrolase [Synergistaceae bacterium]